MRSESVTDVEFREYLKKELAQIDVWQNAKIRFDISNPLEKESKTMYIGGRHSSVQGPFDKLYDKQPVKDWDTNQPDYKATLDWKIVGGEE